MALDCICTFNAQQGEYKQIVFKLVLLCLKAAYFAAVDQYIYISRKLT